MPLSKSKTKPKASTLPEPHVRFRFPAIGTHWNVDIYEPLANQAEVLGTIKRRIATFDKHYSRFRDDSLVADMARTAGKYRLPPDAKPLFDLYCELYELSDGAVTPLIGQTLSDAGYDATYSLQPGTLRHPPAWDEALDYHFPTLVVKQPVLLDVGAAGKGYLVDIVGDVLQHYGVHTFCVDAGGDMLFRTVEAPALDVGLEHPGDARQVIGVAHLRNQSICGSAGNRRTWANFTHIIDPHTLMSPQHIRAVWVVADTTLLADMLTTALFFLPATNLQGRYTFEYALVRQDYSLERSAHFPASFFTEHTKGDLA
jgi:thiamine biosynthesis lipoprotein